MGDDGVGGNVAAHEGMMAERMAGRLRYPHAYLPTSRIHRFAKFYGMHVMHAHQCIFRLAFQNQYCTLAPTSATKRTFLGPTYKNTMKRTLILTMLAATIIGAQALAANDTKLEGGNYKDQMYVGQCVESNINVKISEASSDGVDCSNITVLGTFAYPQTLQGISVSMTGGTVMEIIGRYETESGRVCHVDVSGGTVKGRVVGGIVEYKNISSLVNQIAVSGGTIEGDVIGCINYMGDIGLATVIAEKVSLKSVTGATASNGNIRTTYITTDNCRIAEDVSGAQATGDVTSTKIELINSTVSGSLTGGNSTAGNAMNNTITVAGGTIEGEVLLAQAGQNCVASDNKLILVGSGAQYGKWTGDKITIKNNIVVGGGGGGESGNTGNAIDIYGTGISIENEGQIYGIQELNFCLTNNLLDAEAPMLSMDTRLFLSGIGNNMELNFNAVEALDWKPGDSVTLVNAAYGIQLDPSLLDKEYDIKYTNPMSQEEIVTAKLELIQDGTTLKLTVTGNIPEPATGTLSLLALATLCARRRRK